MLSHFLADMAQQTPTVKRLCITLTKIILNGSASHISRHHITNAILPHIFTLRRKTLLEGQFSEKNNNRDTKHRHQ